MEATVYNSTGKKSGSVTLPESIFGVPWNADLVHQVVTSLRTSARTPVAHTKDRSEVRGGGKKPWQQKGLGRARHGSSRSPIWVGGGVTHGPRNDKTMYRKVNKKMGLKALATVISQKMRDGEVLFVDAVSMKVPKTKEAVGALTAFATIKGFERLGTKRTNAALITFPTKEVATEKSFRNIKRVEVTELRNINPLHLLNYKYMVVVNPEASFKALEARMK